MTFVNSVDLVAAESLVPNLIEFDFSIKQKNLHSLLAKVLNLVSEQAKYLDSLGKVFVTKVELAQDLKKTRDTLETKFSDLFDALDARADKLEARTEELGTSLNLHDVKFQQHQKNTQENLEMLEKQLNDKFRTLDETTHKNVNNINKLLDDVKASSHRLENVYKVLDISDKDLQYTLNIASTTSEMAKRKTDFLDKLPYFQQLAAKVERKMDKSDVQQVSKEVTEQKKKMKVMKEAIKKKFEQVIDTDAVDKKSGLTSEYLQELKQELIELISTKADIDDMNRRFAQKANVSELNQKADHDYMVKLFDRFETDYSNRFKMVDAWSRDLAVLLDHKADRSELIALSARMPDGMVPEKLSLGLGEKILTARVNTNGEEEKQQIASARYKCLTCGTPEARILPKSRGASIPPLTKLDMLDEDAEMIQSARQEAKSRSGSPPHSAISPTRSKKLRPLSARSESWKSQPPRVTQSIIGKDQKVYRGSLEEKAAEGTKQTQDPSLLMWSSAPAPIMQTPVIQRTPATPGSNPNLMDMLERSYTPLSNISNTSQDNEKKPSAPSKPKTIIAGSAVYSSRSAKNLG